jgi:hypothetical protein
MQAEKGRDLARSRGCRGERRTREKRGVVLSSVGVSSQVIQVPWADREKSKYFTIALPTFGSCPGSALGAYILWHMWHNSFPHQSTSTIPFSMNNGIVLCPTRF